jgi:hypothetical protein
MMKNNNKQKLPLCFHHLEEIKYKSYYKAVYCSFYQTKNYNVSKFYKHIANL